MNIVEPTDTMQRGHHYYLRMVDRIYNTRLVLEVSYVKSYRGTEYNDAEYADVGYEDMPFNETPYCSKIFMDNYNDTDVFALFKVVTVVENQNVPLELLVTTPYSKLTKEQRALFSFTIGYTYTEADHEEMIESIANRTTDIYKYKDIDKRNELIWVRLTNNDNTTVLDIGKSFIFTNRRILAKSIKDYLAHPSDSPPIRTWVVSGMTNMTYLFAGLIISEETNALLEGIEDWDVSQVIFMDHMFELCKYFNQPLNKWNVSKVRTMNHMFYRCAHFNQPLNNWTPKAVETMESMFQYCKEFDQDLSTWKILPAIPKDGAFNGTLMKKENHLPRWYITKASASASAEYEISHAAIATYTSDDMRTFRSDIEDFLGTFVDYGSFMNFINDFVREFSPNEYEAYYSKLTPLYFIFSAPDAYRITPDNIPPEAFEKYPNDPFYAAMRYVFSIIPHFAPSVARDPRMKKTTSEHSYMIHLNRLIYFYNLFYLFNEEKLRGFENTGCVCIFAHGTMDPSHKVFLDGDSFEHHNLENIFVCSKAAMGCPAFDYNHSPEDAAHDGELLDDMYEAITSFASIPFDEIRSKLYGCQDELRTSANCRTKTYAFGGPMQHYIGPNIYGFIDKTYGGSITDNTCYIIDVERFHQMKGTSASPVERLNKANLLMNSAVQVRDIRMENGKIMDYEIWLSDIVRYYDAKGKQNLFVYDTSCGSFEDSRVAFSAAFEASDSGRIEGHLAMAPFEADRIQITSDLAREGWGMRKQMAKKKSYRTRKNKRAPRKTRKHHGRRKRGRRTRRGGRWTQK
jgi:hypothetical protein